MKMVSEDFKVGDLVWAKMKSYPPWPARIEEPNPDVKAPKNKKAHFVFFFGTQNFAWILDENIAPHSETQLSNALSKKKSGAYRDAIDALVSYSKETKQTSPLKAKKKKTDDKSPQTKVVKIVNSVPKKHERKVSTQKSPNKTPKRSFYDLNGSHTSYSSPKSRKHQPFNYTSLEFDYDKYAVDVGNVHPFAHFPMWDDVSHEEIYERVFIGSNEVLDKKHVNPSDRKFGFIGLGQMGSAIVKNMIQSGHKVMVWNRSLYKCEKLVKDLGAERADSPAALMVECDVTFCCVSDPDASKALIFGERGILKGLEQASSLGLHRKGYVEMTSIDPDTSIAINEAIIMKQGMYLEAPLCGTSKDAEDGTLLIVASGDKRVFTECETCFHAIGKHAFYLTCEIGYSAKMTLFLSTLSGTMCVAVAEAMVLAERVNISKESFINLLQFGPLSCNGILKKMEVLHHNDEKAFMSLKSILNDINHALKLSNQHSQPMPVTAAANEVYKLANLLKQSDTDNTALYKALQS